MIATSYSTVRQNFKEYCEKATNDFETIIITRERGENVVMISEAEYNNLLENIYAVSYTHLRAHETRHDLVCRLLLEKKKKKKNKQTRDNIYKNNKTNIKKKTKKQK